MSSRRSRKNQVFIFPTRSGFIFLGLTLIMVLAAASGGNNLVFGLAFTLFSVFCLTMVTTHTNLRAIDLEFISLQDAFAGSPVHLYVLVHNSSGKERFLLDLRARDKKLGSAPSKVPVVPPQGQSRAHLAWTVPVRGRYRCPVIRVSTLYPLGLFRAWMYFRFDKEYFVYPEPKGDIALTHSQAVSGSGEHRGQSVESQHADFREHDRYQPGQPYHHVDWKAYARTRRLLIRKYDPTVPHRFSLEFTKIRHLGLELSLSQLAQWVDVLSREQAVYQMQLPNRTIPWASGAQQRQMCLRELATFEQGGGE